MTTLRRQLFGGYHKNETDRYIKELREQFEYKSSEVKNYIDDIKQLKEEIEVLRTRDSDLVSLLVSAKQQAREIIAEAEKEAQEIRDVATRDILRKSELSSKSFEYLKVLQKEIVEKEKAMRDEIVQLMEKHLNDLKQIDITPVEKASNKLTEQLEQAETIVQKNKVLIELPPKFDEKVPSFKFDASE